MRKDHAGCLACSIAEPLLDGTVAQGLCLYRVGTDAGVDVVLDHLGPGWRAHRVPLSLWTGAVDFSGDGTCVAATFIRAPVVEPHAASRDV